MEKQRVLLISNNGIGFYNFKKELIEELLALDYEVHFAVPFEEKIQALIEKGAIFHEITIDRRGINPIKDFGLINQFYRIVKKSKPDVMVLHTIKPNIYASLIAEIQGIPYINNITGLGSALQNESKLAKLLRVMYKISLSESKGIFFENIYNLEYFKKHRIAKENKFIVVPGAGVNTDHFSLIEKRLTKEVTFLFIARVMKEKGIEEYLNAAETIKKNHPNVNFQILGWFDEEGYKSRIESMINDGIIEYIGLSSDTRAEMLQADCIVLPSYHEGMSNVLLEGASMGLPLITTNIHGCKEAVEEGKNGFLCNVRESGSLINAMERLIALSPEERREMGLRGREKMIKEFDRKLVVDHYVKAIRNAIGERL